MPNLTMLIHGESGVGKTHLAATAPGPRLFLDAEGGSKWLPGERVYWDMKSAPPDVKGDVTVIVTVKDFGTLATAHQWLASGKHPFKSVIIDSITECQKRAIDAIAGVEQMRQQDWGDVLRRMEGLVRAFRDLSIPNGQPGLEAVVFVAGSQVKDGVIRAHVQGQLGLTLPYFLDIVGCLGVVANEDGGLTRRLLVAPINGITAKDRTGRLGTFIENPRIDSILELVEV